MNNKDYEIEELAPGLFAIDDSKDDSMYLIEGGEKALLIDTGMVRGNIMPLLSSLTSKPIELALTHAHGDHMYHAEEFKTVYLHEADIGAWMPTLSLVTHAGELMFGVPMKRYNIKSFTPITGSFEFDLGGNTIKTILAKGHTPGSCVFVDEKHEAVFFGDAVGSGLSVWLWPPGCSNIHEYKESVESLLKKLEPYKKYKFLGGHRKQAREGEANHPLDFGLVNDMYTLCQKILNHDIAPRKQKFSIFTIDVYSFNAASIWTRDKPS
jgi:glyoxylase-like metal-dependent hydrolase (beta-lactamase superfamily II)